MNDSTWVTKLIDALPGDAWEGFVGFLVGSAFTWILHQAKRLGDLRPLRRMLKELADDSKSVNVYLRKMYLKDGSLWSMESAPNLKGYDDWEEHRWIQIPELVGAADLSAAEDVASVLATAGRRGNATQRSPYTDFNNWSDPMVAIGGSAKAYRLLERCNPKLVTYDQANLEFVTHTEKEPLFFRSVGAVDFGLVYRGEHRGSQAPCLVVIGLGHTGTGAAGRFFRGNLGEIVSLFPPSGFALMLRSDVTNGREDSSVVWQWPEPSFRRRFFHPVKWRRWKKRQWDGSRSEFQVKRPRTFDANPGAGTATPHIILHTPCAFDVPNASSGDRDPRNYPNKKREKEGE